MGLEAALKDIWTKTTAEVALNVDPVKVKEEIEPKKVETHKKRKIAINQDNQEIKTKPLYNVNSKAIEFGPDIVSGKRNIEKEKKVEMDVVDSILDSNSDRSMKIGKLKKIMIVPKDKDFKEITQCSLCLFQASSWHTLKVHIEMTHLNLRFHCNICKQNSKEKYVMKAHMKKIHKEEDLSKLYFECGRCDIREPFKAFRDHINLFHPDLILFYPNEPFNHSKVKSQIKCSFCDFSAPRPKILSVHVESSHINAEYRCNACNFTCNTVAEIRKHTINNHAPSIRRAGVQKEASKELRQFFEITISKKCLTCQQNMEYRDDFTKHIQSNHPDSFIQRKRGGSCIGKDYHCSEGDYSSNFLHNLSSHQYMFFQNGLNTIQSG